MIKESQDMGTNVLLEFLMSICNNSDWKYAVFWKRKYHQNQTMLIWEEGYCDKLKSRKLFGNDHDDHTRKHISPGRGVSGHTSNGCPVELALSEMACVHHILGEGLVGKVAYSGIHSWTSSRDILAIDHSPPTSEVPSELLSQIEAGIKTIVLVAVAPYGVLQLGSLEVVTEEMGFLSRIVGEFNAIQNHFPIFSSSNSNSVAQSTSSLESILLENSEGSAIVPATFFSDKHLEEIYEIAELPTPFSPSMENSIPYFSIDDISLEFDDSFFSCTSGIYRADIDMPYSPPSDIKEEELKWFPEYNNTSVGIYDDQSAGTLSSHIFADLLENICEAYDAGADDFGISTAYELCESPSNLQLRNHDDVWETLMPTYDAFTGDTGLNDWFHQISNADDLLGAVVANACNEFDKALDNVNQSSELMLQESTEPLSAFSREYIESDSLWSHVPSVDESRSQGISSKISSATTIETMMKKLIRNQFQDEWSGDRKSSEGSKPILRKTRDKSIDKQKRRPRDRQLIQDRLKVLRDLVPNGEKFSIDGLLDRTIKHMMFLRKVSVQSQKLKAYLEVDGEINLKSSQRKDNNKSGASATYQVGGEHDVFPIVVEDLDIPGHMLIEMLCNDHNLFLEVAQVICGLDLTIVKGGMKTRSSSSWAQFVVEVHKGFQRMDVFWPLMQLLQRNPKLLSR